jgi:type I restriction enzyme S subunit
MGKQLSPAARDAPGQFPYLRVANVHLGRIDYADVNTMGFTGAERQMYGLKPGDILLNEGQSLELVGRSAIYNGVEGEFCFQNTLIRFRPHADVLPAYAQMVFEYWLTTGVFASIAKQTTSIAHLGGDRFGSLLFPLISVAAQRRIVEVVESFTELERRIEASIAKSSAVRSGVRESLLAQMEWGYPLSEALSGSIRNGFSPVESARWTGVQMLGLGCLTPLGFAPVQLKNAPPSVSSSHAAVLSDGDVLMSRANTRDLVGLVGVYQDVGTPCIYPDLMMRMRPSSRCSSHFLEIALMSDRARRMIRSMAQGTSDSMVKISAGAVRDLRIPLPDIADQVKLLSALGDLTRQLRKEGAELAKMRRLKQGFVGDLLSGRIEAAAVAT